MLWDDSLPTAARLESLIISVRYWFGLASFFFLLTFDFVLYSLDPFPAAWKVSSFKPLLQHDFFCATQQPEECIPTFMRKLRALERLDPQRLERWKPLPKFFLMFFYFFLPKLPIMDFLDTPLKFNMEPESMMISKTKNSWWNHWIQELKISWFSWFFTSGSGCLQRDGTRDHPRRILGPKLGRAVLV